ncbi:MAG: aminoglycoside phosphotransferase family protein [Planctomycetota bacterium]
MIERLSGGTANRTYRVTLPSAEATAPLSDHQDPTRGVVFALKSYCGDDGAAHDRAGTEMRFLRYAWSVGVRAIPRPFECDRVAGLLLMEYVDGSPISVGQVGDHEMREAAAFLRALNRFREAAGDLPDAHEAAFRLADHVENIEARVTRLTSTSSGWSTSDVVEFLSERLVPQWTSVRDELKLHAAEIGLSFDSELPIYERVVSPVDFGFHNALRTPAGPLTFVDFEGAGWDDPARLVCDFFTQPAVPVPDRYLSGMVDELAAILDLDDERAELLAARVELLLPIYRVKWCCRLLGELSPAGRARREYTGGGIDEAGIHAQLTKALQLLENVSA